jgi:type I restriction enzyme, S subunit
MKCPSLPISSFCTTGSGGTPSRANVGDYYDGTIPWVKSGELREGVILDSEEKITALAIKESSAKLVPKGALLIAMYGATIGRIAELGVEGTTNQAICHIVPDEKIADKRYLFYGLRFRVPELIAQGAGGAQPNINQQIIRDTQLPLPPLPEQKRIAAILDKAASIRRKRHEAVWLAEELLRSAFLDMFGDPVTNPKGWKEAALTDVAEIVSGVTKGRKLDGKQTVLAPYLRVANVQDGYLNLSEIKEIEVLPSDIDKYRLLDGDILLTEGGDPDKLGRGTVWRAHIEDCIHQNHIFRVRIKSDNLLPDFLSVLIGSERGKRYFLRAAKQTTGIASINSTQLKNFPVLMPSLDLQQRFAKSVVRTRKLKERLIETETTTDTLFNSLLQRAFKGGI